MPLNFLVDQIAGSITDLLGLRNKETSPTAWENVQVLDNGITKTVEDVAKSAYDTLTKYWYIPVIIGGVIVAYLVLRKSPAANVAEIVGAIAAAQN